MSKEPMINFKSIQPYLDKVDYTRRKDNQGNFTIKIDDSIEAQKVSPEGFTLKAVRTVELDPKALFKIKVVYIIECEFDEDAKTYFNEDLEKIKAFIEKRKTNIVKSRNIGNQMSLIIGQLSSFHSMNPLIIPPYPSDVPHTDQ